MTDLGSSPGLDSAPTAIDDDGEVVGMTETHDVGNPVEAVLWKNGKLVKLGRFGAAASQAVAINSRGHILIDLINANGDTFGGLLLKGARDLRVRPLSGQPPADQGGPLNPLKLNNLDQVVGYGYTSNGARRSFLWQSGKTTLLPTFDGTNPPWGAPTAINNDGIVVGTSYVSALRSLSTMEPHIVIWTPQH